MEVMRLTLTKVAKNAFRVAYEKKGARPIEFSFVIKQAEDFLRFFQENYTQRFRYVELFMREGRAFVLYQTGCLLHCPPEELLPLEDKFQHVIAIEID
jgi:hypothetical protein